ncbi:MAG: cupin domain-containing protein [Thermoplasmata archaeon]|nr:MAG: cupin domain-containing protein [Thermoplasmata archaeon]
MIFKPFPISKGWGKELWITNHDKYCGKILCLNKDSKCSLHFHVKKHETFCVIKGKVEMIIVEDAKRYKFIMKPYDSIEIPPGRVHQFIGLEDSEIMEISTTHRDDDSYRVEPGDSQLQARK